ncbi:unnamed protein product [Pedinophyceae sp. YPF-701]|nr:unnamed protein product [Pedinophyceae sp. YPF-701]
MSNLLGKFGKAREDGFFKAEQEAAISVIRRRKMVDGKMQLVEESPKKPSVARTHAHPMPNGLPDPPAERDISGVLAEVHAAEARMGTGSARSRAEAVPRPVARLPEPDREAVAAAASAMVRRKYEPLGGFALGTLPARGGGGGASAWASLPDADHRRQLLRGEGWDTGKPRGPPVSKEAIEGARRAQAVAVRALAYGAAGAVTLVSLAAVFVTQGLGVRSAEELRAMARRGAGADAKGASGVSWGGAEEWRGRLRGFFRGLLPAEIVPNDSAPKPDGRA